MPRFRVIGESEPVTGKPAAGLFAFKGPMEQRSEALAWIGPALEGALGTNSPILCSFRAGKTPTLNVIASLATAGHEDSDREILLISEVFLVVADLLLKTDPETSDRGEIANACGELGRLGAWLAASKPRTLNAARRLIAVAVTILDARISAPESALAQGPAADLLVNSARVL